MDNRLECATWDYAWQSQCNKYGPWIEGKYCQQSCYDNGAAYDGDFCCPAAPPPPPSRTPVAGVGVKGPPDMGNASPAR